MDGEGIYSPERPRQYSTPDNLEGVQVPSLELDIIIEPSEIYKILDKNIPGTRQDRTVRLIDYSVNALRQASEEKKYEDPKFDNFRLPEDLDAWYTHHKGTISKLHYQRRDDTRSDLNYYISEVMEKDGSTALLELAGKLRTRHPLSLEVIDAYGAVLLMHYDNLRV